MNLEFGTNEIRIETLPQHLVINLQAAQIPHPILNHPGASASSPPHTYGGEAG
jgi:hypothetical protein